MPQTDLSVFTLVHDALRAELPRLGRVARQIHSDEHRALVEHQLAICLHTLLAHEALETEWLFPTIRNRAPESGPGIDTLVEDHERIVHLAGQLSQNGHRLEERAPLLDELSAIVEQHIERETRDLIPYVQRVLTREEWDGFSYSTLNSIEDDDLPIILAWLLTSGTAEDQTRAKALLPTDVRIRLRLSWIPRYRKRLEALYVHL